MIRPYLREALIQLKTIYDIYIFSAGESSYCNALVNQFIDPQNELINGILSREYCLKTNNGYYIKDLRVIANRELGEMVIVDNLVHSFAFQIGNGVPIMSWAGDVKDQELKFLAEYLIEIGQKKDLIQANLLRFQWGSLIKVFMQLVGTLQY